MRIKSLKTTEQTSFKQRRKQNSKMFRLKFGCAAIYVSKEIRFEPVYFSLFRKWVKIYLNFKKYPFLKNQIWLNLYYNYPISKKSKNARMGKGKGNFFRWSIKLPRYCIIAELRNLNKLRAGIFFDKIRYKIHSLNFFVKM
jgi:ribosomal protein L16/L10AE